MKQVWITGQRLNKNSCYAFALDANAKIDSSDTLKIAALNFYNIFINGEFVRFGPEKTAHGFIAVDEIGLGEYVSEDSKTVIAVFVTGSNVDNFDGQNLPPFFSAEIVGADGKTKYSTDDFSAHLVNDRVIVVNRYSYQRRFSECYNMDGSREAFINGDFSRFPKVETEVVEGCKEVERETNLPTYERITADLIRTGKVFEDEKKPVCRDRFLQSLPEKNGFVYDTLERCPLNEIHKFVIGKNGAEGRFDYKLYDFRANVSGFINLNVNVTSPKARIYIAWDEILTPTADGNILDFFRMRTANVISYDLTCGEHNVITVEPYTYRYMAIIVTEGSACVSNPVSVLLENPDAGKLKFECEDADFVKIVDAARATFAQNCVDIPTDCPSRERAGWLCDSYFTGKAEKLFTGMNKVEAHHLTNYAYAPYFSYFEDGVVPMCYPGDFASERYIPNWMMWYIIELADNIKRTGNRKSADQAKDKVKGLIEFFKRYENSMGLLEKLPSWVFVEWSKANDLVQDINFPSNMCYVGMLRAAAEILGDGSLNDKADKLRETIRKVARKGIFFVDNAMLNDDDSFTVTENTTETCQYYALYFGIADKDGDELDKKLFETMLNEFGATRDYETVYPTVYKANAFIGNYLRLDYLFNNGYARRASDECKDYFVYMADRTGTLWENDTVSASCNHGFASYAANITLGGITGFKLADEAGKKAVFCKDVTRFDTDCTLSIPLSDGQSIVIVIRNGKRNVILPDGYEMCEE